MKSLREPFVLHFFTAYNPQHKHGTVDQPQELHISCVYQLIEQLRHTLFAAFSGEAGAGRVQATVFRAV